MLDSLNDEDEAAERAYQEATHTILEVRDPAYEVLKPHVNAFHDSLKTVNIRDFNTLTLPMCLFKGLSISYLLNTRRPVPPPLNVRWEHTFAEQMRIMNSLGAMCDDIRIMYAKTVLQRVALIDEKLSSPLMEHQYVECMRDECNEAALQFQEMLTVKRTISLLKDENIRMQRNSASIATQLRMTQHELLNLGYAHGNFSTRSASGVPEFGAAPQSRFVPRSPASSASSAPSVPHSPASSFRGNERNPLRAKRLRQSNSLSSGFAFDDIGEGHPLDGLIDHSDSLSQVGVRPMGRRQAMDTGESNGDAASAAASEVAEEYADDFEAGSQASNQAAMSNT